MWARLLIVAFLSYLLLGCGKDAPSNPKGIKGRIVGTGNVGKTQAIVLIHGLENYGELEEMRTKLASDFSNAIVVDLNRTNSNTSSISQQAEDAFKELQRLNIVDKEIILIGDSQGGLLGWELYDSYKDQLKVKLLITNHTPWEGAPLAKATVEIIERIKSELRLFGNVLGTTMEKLLFGKMFGQSVSIGSGVTDLIPNSSYLQKVRSNLLHAEIPIVAIGGTIDAISGFAILVDLNPEGIKVQMRLYGVDLNTVNNIIEPIFSEIIGHQENDAVIPLDSQLAKNIPTNDQFRRETINDYHHFASIMEEPAYPLIVKTIKDVFQPVKTN
ncbi:MAG: hypothetical protein BGO68_00455 [Candidatus Amoebophilus sp. 36-38]|nr:MAG: hypothetical protein BGO68_00455 [Candidatus Amoebophilus sp. 36-38]